MHTTFIAANLCYAKMFLIFAFVAYIASGESTSQLDTDGVVPSTRALRTMDGPEEGNFVDETKRSTTKDAEERMSDEEQLSRLFKEKVENVFNPKKLPENYLRKKVAKDVFADYEALKLLPINEIFESDELLLYILYVHDQMDTPIQVIYKVLIDRFGADHVADFAVNLRKSILSTSDPVRQNILGVVEQGQFSIWLNDPYKVLSPDVHQKINTKLQSDSSFQSIKEEYIRYYPNSGEV